MLRDRLRYVWTAPLGHRSLAQPSAGAPGRFSSEQDRTPRNLRIESIRRIVLRRWKKVLGEASITEGLTWSEAGGDSLKLFELVCPLEKDLQCALPFDLFYPDMCFEDFVGCIKDAINRSRLGQLPCEATVVVLPGLGGDGPSLGASRQELADKFSLCVVSYPALRELFSLETSFERIVDSVCAQIIADRPAKEIYLVGYSFGGLIATRYQSDLSSQGGA
jgi:acyl carrier protein